MTASVLVCPRCGTTAVSGSRFCEEDGTRLSAPVAPPAAADPVVAPSGGCRCAAPNDPEGTGFCETCGVRIRVSQIQGPAALGPDLAIATDRGTHHWRNEDAGAIGQELVDGAPCHVLVVCDGVSSASSSDRAAAIAADTARSALLDALRSGQDADPDHLEARLADAIQVAHRTVCERHLEPEAGKDPPGATIVAALARPGLVAVGWLGDSRAYWLGEGEARQLTRDDSWAVEQVESGAMTLEEALAAPAAHAITHCIGPLEGLGGDEPIPTVPPISPHTLEFRPAGPGLLVLCSDGLWQYASEPEAFTTLVGAAAAEADAEARAWALLRHALDSGGADNVIVAVARLL
jgi:serine/threonine protein phosphatase PrpC